MDEKTRRNEVAIAYLRIASQHPQDTQALDRQRAGCDHIAAKRGLTIVREYCDVGRPARLEQQHEMLRMLRDLGRNQDVAFVVVWDYSRLAQDLEQLQSIIDWIENCEAEVVTLTGVEAAARFVEEHQQAGMRENERRYQS